MSGLDDPLNDDDAPARDDRPVPPSVRRLVGWHVSHRTRSIDSIGSLAPNDPIATAERIAGRDPVAECVPVVTCNRIEVYASAAGPADREAALDAIRTAVGDPPDARTLEGRAVVDRLGRVACGLESRVLGEGHVLGQVRRALERADEAGLLPGVLGRAGDAMLRAGRACREETGIDEGRSSYGTATCDVVAERGGTPDRIVVVGAGEVATTVAAAADRRWTARVDVVNRSAAPALASDDGRWWPLADVEAALADADAIVSATGAPDAVLDDGAAAALPDGATVVDLANPDDVGPAVRAADATEVVDLEAVQRRLRGDAERRASAVPAATSRLSRAVDRFETRERERAAEDAVRALHREAAAVRERELDRARRRLAEGDAEPAAVLEDFAGALESALLATPTDRLRAAAREGDETAMETARWLFALDDGTDDR